MTDLVWHDFLEIGVDFIDDDHRRLLRIMQNIKEAIEDNDFTKCTRLLNKLITEAREHFSREEEYLLKVKYPDLVGHKAYHRELLLQADTTKRICEGTVTDHDLKECFDAMANFLIDDILRGDIQFKSYLEYNSYI